MEGVNGNQEVKVSMPGPDQIPNAHPAPKFSTLLIAVIILSSVIVATGQLITYHAFQIP